MIGKKFGRLEVVSLLDRRSSGGRLLYECRCECGNLKTALIGSLHSGHTKSCECDNPSCVNPAHLFLGTHADNSHDKSEKLRGIHGVKNPHSKLTEAQALFILAANLPLAMLAKMFSVRHQSISAIKRGVTWSYLKKPELLK